MHEGGNGGHFLFEITIWMPSIGGPQCTRKVVPSRSRPSFEVLPRGLKNTHIVIGNA